MKPDNLESHSKRAVPQGSFNRMVNMGSLGASIAAGTVAEIIKQSIVSSNINIREQATQ
jgi:hypothetical protein